MKRRRLLRVERLIWLCHVEVQPILCLCPASLGMLFCSVLSSYNSCTLHSGPDLSKCCEFCLIPVETSLISACSYVPLDRSLRAPLEWPSISPSDGAKWFRFYLQSSHWRRCQSTASNIIIFGIIMSTFL